jgi:rfaE bifunctional protein kinase chain/domain
MSDLVSRVRPMAGLPVLIIGDLMVDRYIRGSVNRISPEAPVPVVDVHHEEFMPGGAGNVASNIAALGGKPRLVSLVGEDPDGDRLLGTLRDRGVDVSSVVADPNRPTILKNPSLGRASASGSLRPGKPVPVPQRLGGWKILSTKN